MKESREKARLETLYNDVIKAQLQKKLDLKNIMEVPKVSKIVVNVGVKEAIADTKSLQAVSDVIARICGQRPIRTFAKKSIAGFKLRQGVPIGIMVTLRRKRMYEFLDRLIALALPKVRDFQGVPLKLDGRGNYNLGVREWAIFPEVEYDVGDKVNGMNITIQTTAQNDKNGLALLESFGMPFRKA